MSKLITTSFSPNADKKQKRAVLRWLFNPLKWTIWKRGEYINAVEKKLGSYINQKYSVTFNTGRTALYAALKALGIQSGDEVIVQGYTCVSVPNAVLWTGARPIYVDIEKDFNAGPEKIRDVITSKTKVIITQNTFGKPSKIEEIRKIADEHALYIIEDVAHALGAEVSGRKVGSFGDISIFSFGRDKVISSIAGGAATTNNAVFGKELRSIQEGFSDMSFISIKKHLLHPLLSSLILSTYSFFNLGKALSVLFKKIRITPLVLTAEEKCGKMPKLAMKRLPNVLAYLALEQLGDVDKKNAQRVKKAQYYSLLLSGLGGVEFPQGDAVEDSVYLRYTICVKNADKLKESAKSEQVILGDWYSTVIAPKDTDIQSIFYTKGECPHAEEKARCSVNLPNHDKISRADQDKVITLIKKFLKKDD